MAYELTWAFDANRAYTPGVATDLTKYQMWYMMTFLICGPGMAVYQNGANGCWTYEGSSNGTNSDMSANIANFKLGTVGTFNAADWTQITAAPASSAHSWVVLKSPQMPDGGYTYLLISAYHLTTGGFSVHHSRNAWVLASTGTWQPVNPLFMPATTTSANLLTNDGTTTQRNFSGGLATNGQFFVMDAKNGSGFVWYGCLWAPTTGYQTGDLFPFYFDRYYNASTPGFGSPTAITNTSTTAINSGRGGVDSRIGINQNPLVQGVLYGAQLKDQITGDVFDMPFHVWWSDVASFWHYRGRLKDIGWNPSGNGTWLTTGSTIREAGNVKYVTVGVWILPFNTTLTL